MRVRSEHTITHKVEKAAPAADGKLGFEGDAQTQAKEAKIGTIQGDLAVWEEAKKALPVGPQDAQVLCHNCLQPSFRVCVHVCCMFSLSLSLSLYLSLSLSISLSLSAPASWRFRHEGAAARHAWYAYLTAYRRSFHTRGRDPWFRSKPRISTACVK